MTGNNQTRMSRRKQKKSQQKPLWKKIVLYALYVMLALGIVTSGLFIYYIATAPKIDVEKLTDPFSSQVFDKDGNTIGELGAEQRTKIEYDDLPEILIDAVTATEDVRFFDHIGIDIRRIGGAIKANFSRGFGAEGASTITQQVAENAFLESDKKLKIKVQEQWLALKLEREYSKEEIMEMYLNKIYYGSGAYGVAKASEIYFGKTDLHDLTLIEAAILAGLPQRPSGYDPFKNPDQTEERVDTVLQLMVRHDKITEEEAEEAREVEVASLLTEKKSESTPYEAFIQQVRREVKEKVDGADIHTDGLKIYTTLDPKAQEHVELLLTDSEENPIDYPNDEFQAGMVVLDTKTGEIRAIGGGRNREDMDEYNFAIQGGRQPGSTFKPILAYGPAIEYKNISTYHQLKDEGPYEIYDNEIQNWNREYQGQVSARHALYQSLNVPTLNLFEENFKETGYEEPKEFAERLGINFANESIDEYDAIGGSDTDVTPLQLAGAFRPFGNEGIYNEPYAVTKVELPDGKVVELQPESEEVMSDYTAYMVTDMLKDVLTIGTGSGNANIPELHVAGKTGTTNIPETNDANNSWLAGYTTNYTIAAWTGYQENDRELETTQIPHQLFKNTMLELSKDIETDDFTKPGSVVEVDIEKGTNPPMLPSADTPGDNIITELFVKGHEPTEMSEQYDELDPVSNLQADYNGDQIEITWDYDDDDVNFEVSSSVDDGEMSVLSTTDDHEMEIDHVDEGSTYEIQVIAIDKNDDSRKSESRSTKIDIPEADEEDENNNENENENENNENEDEEPDIPAVDHLSAEFIDEGDGFIDVSWDYDGPNANFIVDVNGAEQQVTDQHGIEIHGIQRGETYTITITPIGLDGVNKDHRGPPKTTDEIYIEDEEPLDEAQ